MSNPTPLNLGSPLDLDDGRRAASLLARQCRDAVAALEAAVTKHAETEQSYRLALAKRLVVLRGEAVPVTAANDIARGDDKVAELRYDRDLAEGMVLVARERLRQLDGERASLRQLLEWSQRFSQDGDGPPLRRAA